MDRLDDLRARDAEKTISSKLHQMQQAQQSAKSNDNQSTTERLYWEIEYEGAETKFWRSSSQTVVALQKFMSLDPKHRDFEAMVEATIPLVHSTIECDRQAWLAKRQSLPLTLSAPLKEIGLGARITSVLATMGRGAFHVLHQLVGKMVLWGLHTLLNYCKAQRGSR
ncbi:hypothetical protein LTR56_012427 [Elasticomyces elasticus]|nr:hypothetical protein LTR22_020810 [Elasticomyces elasticus]KAK3639456.1 hypothetical protein LTR56_012427 [Elasticomyces elasticus]KAK4909634.1 hypothetical protein LTR49_021608 [Elasticomyces elasticus]KAK5752718.1 hypothetical protein LTS12_017190 [Elasticomyces elasticus]